MGLLPNGRTAWLVNGGDPNYLLTGMILQVARGILTSSLGVSDFSEIAGTILVYSPRCSTYGLFIPDSSFMYQDAEGFLGLFTYKTG